MPQIRSSKAQSYRYKAKSCEGLVAYALSPEDRTWLLRVRDSYLSLAAKEDSLDGLPPTPPDHVIALRPWPRTLKPWHKQEMSAT